MRTYLILIFSFIILISCNKAKGQGERASENKAYTTALKENVNDESQDKDIDIQTLKSLLKNAEQMRASLLNRLKNSTPEQADDIYKSKDYRFDRTKEFTSLDSLLFPVMQRWMDAGFEEKELDGQDKQILEILKEQGVEPFYIGEGITELSINSHYYYHIFKDFVTNETADYIKILSDQDYLIVADAGLVVPTDSLYNNSIAWEKYLEKYPESKHKEAAIYNYGIYMNLIMFSNLDNTPTFDYQTKKIYDNLLEDIKRLASRGHDSKTDYILKEYLKELEKTDFVYTEELENKIMSLWVLKDYDRADSEYE